MTGKVVHSLGTELLRDRRARGDTQGSMAAKVGVAENTYGKWERGEALPSASNMRALVRLGLAGGRRPLQNAGEREVLALFRSFSADKRKAVLDLLHLVVEIAGPGS